MTEIRDGREAEVAALMDEEEGGRGKTGGRAAEEPEETKNCEVDDVNTLPVCCLCCCFVKTLPRFDLEMCDDLFLVQFSTV